MLRTYLSLFCMVLTSFFMQYLSKDIVCLSKMFWICSMHASFLSLSYLKNTAWDPELLEAFIYVLILPFSKHLISSLRRRSYKTQLTLPLLSEVYLFVADFFSKKIMIDFLMSIPLGAILLLVFVCIKRDILNANLATSRRRLEPLVVSKQTSSAHL